MREKKDSAGMETPPDSKKTEVPPKAGVIICN